jgi:DNA-binding NtrC family response regulator
MDNAKVRVLLIEDDKIDQKAFERMVKKENLPYDCRIAGSISQAKRILGTNEHFDAIIMDFRLSDGCAFDILGTYLIEPPVIFVTGAGDEETAVKALKSGVSDYVIKDHERNYIKTLPSAIENAIHRKNTDRGLSGLLPICASCKDIRDHQGHWKKVEVYIRDRSKADFSHGLCPNCAIKLYPELFKDYVFEHYK